MSLTATSISATPTGAGGLSRRALLGGLGGVALGILGADAAYAGAAGLQSDSQVQIAGGRWVRPDPSKPTAATGRFFVMGTVFADPQGQGTRGVYSGTTWRYQKPVPSSGKGINRALAQFRDAGVAAGGHATVIREGNHHRCVIHGLRLSFTNTDVPDLVGASGPQVRAFLAAVIQNEGSTKGLIADDPDEGHVRVVREQLAKPEAYSVPSAISSTRFKKLTIESKQFASVQAYPYVAYGRVPGGTPSYRR